MRSGYGDFGGTSSTDSFLSTRGEAGELPFFGFRDDIIVTTNQINILNLN